MKVHLEKVESEKLFLEDSLKDSDAKISILKKENAEVERTVAKQAEVMQLLFDFVID